MMKIKKGQVYKDSDGHRYIIVKHDDTEVILQCLDDTPQFFPGELIPYIMERFLERNLEYVETLQFTDELILDLKLKELQTELDFVQCTLNNYTNKKENILEQIKQLQEEKEKIKCI